MKKIPALLIGAFLISLKMVPAMAASVSDGKFFTGLIVSWENAAENTKTADGKLWLRVRAVKTNEWTEWYEVKADADIDEKDDAERGTLNAERGKNRKENLFSTNLSNEYEYVADEGVRNVRIEKILSDRPRTPQLMAGLDIPKKFRIISRPEWGANEEITLERDSGNPMEGIKINETEETEKSEISKEDAEISKIVTHDESGRRYVWPLEYAKDVKFIVIHHTASVANLENPKTAIQNIEYYHAVRRGWGDIGYNYLIDTQGNVYEGRKGGEGVVGGHAKPLNKASIGIAVLGNYENEELPTAVLKNLLALINEKAKFHGITVGGKTMYKEKIYNNIQGHFENSATLCPGKFLKQKLEGVKTLIAYHGKKEKKAQPEKANFSDFEKRDIIVAAPDTKKEFVIRLKNTGEVKWRKRNTFLELRDSKEPATLSLQETPNTTASSAGGAVKKSEFPKILARLESPKVEPGNIGVFRGTIPKTLISGLLIPEVSLVINGSIRPAKEIPIPIMVEGLRATYEMIARKNPPEKLKPGQKTLAWIKLKNTGNFTWRRTGENRVAIETSRPTGRKSALFSNKKTIGLLKEKSVKPGKTGTFLFTVKAPQTSGSFSEYFQPTIKGVSAMADTGMHFAVRVEGDEKPLRVALSFKGKPKIRSRNGMKLFEGKTLVHKFGKNETARVARLKSGGYRVKNGDKKFDLKGPPRFLPNARAAQNTGTAAKNNNASDAEPPVLEIVNFENRPAWNKTLNDNLFRGILEIRSVNGKLLVINELPLEEYLKGLAEISNSDPKEKIKTIIIMARSYAKYYRDTGKKFPGKPFDLDDDPDHTQKYVGYGLELRSPNIISAVEETVGRIVTYQDKPIITPYFSQSDGRTLSAEKAWGWKDAPYLVGVPDPFCKTTERKGHGVGLSGCGAAELAKQGKTAEEIIKYYLTGVEITGEK